MSQLLYEQQRGEEKDRSTITCVTGRLKAVERKCEAFA